MEQFVNYLSSLPSAVAQGVIWGIMAIGVFITYKILDLADLTVDGTICTGAAVCATMMTLGFSMPVAMLCAFVAGMLAGFLTGVFHTSMGIPAILAGILTQLVLWSVNLKVMGIALDKTSAANLPLSSRNFDTLVSMLELEKTLVVLLIITIVLIGVLYWFFGTEYGCSLRSTGANLNMSRAQGINTNVAKVVGLVLSNGIVAFAGALLAQYQGNADINMGKGAIVIGLAAVIIGEALFGWLARHNFSLKLLSVIFGGIIYFIVYSTVIYLGLDSNYLKMLSAIVVAIFLAVPYWKGKYFSGAEHIEKRKHKKDKSGKEV
ncbi:MAG: ABC transporter permease [Clostridia bacterium]|nr:ABC transporter permease [Clostridiales bacterium]MBR2302460.1 ABC transporter permease [Clostridia bacterium]